MESKAQFRKQNKEQKPKDKVTINENPYPSTYTPIEGKPTLITNVTILDGIGNKIDKGAVLFSDGKIVGLSTTPLGESLPAPEQEYHSCPGDRRERR